MFEDVKQKLFRFLTSRITVLGGILVLCAAGLIARLFSLQLVHGQEYLDSFQLMIRKERSIPGVRGNIYDRNGNLLAYNELTYSVTIEDVFDSGRGHNRNLNNSVSGMLDILERNGDALVLTFPIELDEQGEYAFTLSGTQHMRFLADVYGRQTIQDLEYRERTKTAAEVIEDLSVNFGVGDYADPENSSTFVPGLGVSKERALKLITVRYAMMLTGYQKYIETVVAEGISDRTVADIRENASSVPGVDVAESTMRRYVDGVYFSQIIGYTGSISQDELEMMQAENPEYALNDIVGKAGIEQTMESALQGQKGSETVFVDKMGKVIEVGEHIDPLPGNDLYLTIDKDLQMAAYDLLESRIAGIILQRLEPVRVAKKDTPSKDMIIPIYDVYFALFKNNVIDISHFGKADAQETERKAHQAFTAKIKDVQNTLEAELRSMGTPYNQLTQEYKVYQTMITSMLYNHDIINSDLVDRTDKTYIAWTTDEVISLREFLQYCIAMNWIDVTLLSLEDPYSDAETVYDALVNYTMHHLSEDGTFRSRLFKYLIDDDVLTGRDVCNLLIEQNIVTLSEEETDIWDRAGIDAYHFMVERIRDLDITPAQLALDPCSGSMVITDVNTGDVLALVSYPSYDNNRIQNKKYFARVNNDLSRPLYNFATQQRTAPGSTFKMVSATAGMEEGVVAPESTFGCVGEFALITPSPKCWIYPGGHGTLNMSGAIKHSCNNYFFNVGYRLGSYDGKFSNDLGVEKLRYYAEQFGLTDLSGIEIAENDPQVSTMDAVRTAIGQGNSGYTTVGLARYVTAVANRGTVYNLTLIDRLTDSAGAEIYDNSATVRNRVEMNTHHWNTIHEGMRGMVEAQPFFDGIGVNVAGKTGTAEESRSRADHALFVSFAPYENPQISVTVRVAFGYTSSYPAQIAKDFYRYYYHPELRNEILSHTADEPSNQVVND
ncbi:MAG: penicillin-binding protein [Lachnospiraceae bacterium]|nr:penicillin-binding protein [Lachnospiraceae bacterium]